MNQKLDLDFIKQPSFSLFSWSWLGVSVFLLSLVLATFTWQRYQTRQLALDEISLKLNQVKIQDKVTVTHVEVADKVAISAEKKAQLEDAVSALTVPWESLFIAIEKSDLEDVALLNLAPSYKKQQVLITGEAKDLQSALDYVQRLEAQPMLQNVYLQKHNMDALNVDDPSSVKPVGFAIFAQWDVTK